MSICALLAGGLLLLALLAHFFVGTNEYKTCLPPPDSNVEHQAWVQGLGGWHFVTVDLLAMTSLFFAIGLSDWLPCEP
ncbi:MAG: hypothetical protein AAFX06_25475, partial [Planctomycetota bacterium]